MSSYEVADHLVDHPPLFMCRKHKSFLKLNRSFVEELIAWAPDLQPQNLTDVAATSLGGDDQAFRLSDYLVPPKLVIFNPRKIPGHGALPYLVVLVDRKFFGIPASYLRRRIFEGCEQCAAENDPTSDASFPDYKPPVKKPAPQPAPQPAPGATRSGPMPAVAKPSAQPKPPTQKAPAVRPPAQQSPGQPVPTKSIPKRPAEPKFDVPPPPH
ncbi:MAG TPA: hypothetical protein VFF73_04600 [Planctomycetota bacterium]|nr:hypothetical protein [Planctomycetota bacterium]